MLRYKQLLHYAGRLPALPASARVAENKVAGCVSQVWVLPRLADGRVFFAADSDSALTKGLAALLVEGLSGSTPAEVLAVTPGFVEALGLRQSLTPSRNNGFLNMLALMQRKTLALVNACGEGAEQEERAAAPAGAPSIGPVQAALRSKLTSALAPSSLAVVDDSAKHSGHNGTHGLRAGETHFGVEVVSAAFEGLGPVARHRLVYAALADELAGGVHALSLVTLTPHEKAKAAGG